MQGTDISQCYAFQVKGQIALLRAAMPTFNANPDGGVFLITSSIAGVYPGGSSMAYSVTKAAQLHLMKCLASSQGAKVRVNAVLPGLLMTEWVSFGVLSLLLYHSVVSPLTSNGVSRGYRAAADKCMQGQKYSPEAVKNLKERAVLKTDTDLDDCADAFTMLAKNSSMTGTKVQIGKPHRFAIP